MIPSTDYIYYSYFSLANQEGRPCSKCELWICLKGALVVVLNASLYNYFTWAMVENVQKHHSIFLIM